MSHWLCYMFFLFTGTNVSFESSNVYMRECTFANNTFKQKKEWNIKEVKGGRANVKSSGKLYDFLKVVVTRSSLNL